MNYLAHLAVALHHSGWNDISYLLGNVLADHTKGDALARVSPSFRLGTQLHRKVDLFTDSHPIVARAMGRLPASRRRFAGILVDLWFDHSLAKSWNTYFDTDLRDTLYRWNQAVTPPALPEEEPGVLEQTKWMVQTDLLWSYGNSVSIQQAIGRISRRLKDPPQLQDAFADVYALRTDLDSDFAEYFPELLAESKTWP